MVDTFDDLLQSLDDLQTTSHGGGESYRDSTYNPRESFNFADLEPVNTYSESEPERLSFNFSAHTEPEEAQIYIPEAHHHQHEEPEHHHHEEEHHHHEEPHHHHHEEPKHHHEEHHEVHVPPPVKSSYQSQSSYQAPAPAKSSFQSQSSYQAPAPVKSSYQSQSSYQPPAHDNRSSYNPNAGQERTGDLRKFQRESVYVPSGGSHGGSHGGSGGSDRCAKCGEGIFGEHLTALGKSWHPNHFNCAGCNSELRGPFYDHGGKPHCTNCIGNMMPCSRCHRGITNQYVIQDGRPFHTDCVERKRCVKCSGAITDTVMTANGQHYHPRCFTCTNCHRELDGQFIQNQGRPLCEPCAHQTRPSCMTCRQPLSGEFVSFDGKGFHQNCFVCSRCNTRLDLNGFFSVGGAYRCKNCK